MKNIFSIDLESWVHFYEDSLKLRKFTTEERKKLDAGYMVKATKALLQLLDRHHQKATFFVVSEIHEWYPGLIAAIKMKGHEIGHHTHTHPLLRSAAVLKKELQMSRKFFNDFRPRGFRAPQIYLPQEGMKLLENAGFTYSSSTYDEYVVTKFGGMQEIPVSAISYTKQSFVRTLPKPLTIKLLMNKLPIGSGLSLAVFGAQTSRFIRYLNAQKIPAILFIHPWQLYQPRSIASLGFKARLLSKNPLCFPYTRNITSCVDKLFKAHQFTSFQLYFHEQQGVLGQ